MAIKKIAIIGDGGWGTTLAILLSHKRYNIKLWSAFPDYAAEMAKARENTRFLPGIKIPAEIEITPGLEGVKQWADLYVMAVPCKYLRETVNKIGSFDKDVVSAVKGIENESLQRPSQMIHACAGRAQVAVLSGPTIAYDAARGLPTTCVAASDNKEFARAAQEVFSTERFRVYTSDDVTGVELGGALKNVIAIAAGISDGMGFGDNTKAAILTRGLVEIIRLGTAMGAKKDTFYGLSGVGDLATTCMSPHSRNRHVGVEIGKGRKLKDVLAETRMVAEGINTARSAYDLAKKYKVEMPITEQVYRILYEDKEPKAAVMELMTRSPKGEV